MTLHLFQFLGSSKVAELAIVQSAGVHRMLCVSGCTRRRGQNPVQYAE